MSGTASSTPEDFVCVLFSNRIFWKSYMLQDDTMIGPPSFHFMSVFHGQVADSSKSGVCTCHLPVTFPMYSFFMKFALRDRTFQARSVQQWSVVQQGSIEFSESGLQRPRAISTHKPMCVFVTRSTWFFRKMKCCSNFSISSNFVDFSKCSQTLGKHRPT